MNLTLLTDFYQLTMMNVYFKQNIHKKIAIFDLFFRENKYFNYGVFSGIYQALEYIENIKFEENDIKFLESKKIFDKDFLEYLREFKFTGEIFSVDEGEIVFPNEPLISIKAPLIEAQFVETALLNIVGHQTLIASKARRIVTSAKGKTVVELGLRRAHGVDAGIYGTRAAIIGGCKATSNLLAAKMFDLDLVGTHAHSFVMSFDSEREAFEKFAQTFPNNITLLVDTYNTLKSGMQNAIAVLKKYKDKNMGIRLDSGDLAYLSKKARKMLDDNGLQQVKIYASNDIDEFLIDSLESQGTAIDVYGIGTKLITSFDCASLGCVYKLVAFEENDKMMPKIKISESAIKVTNPAEKQVHRLYKNGYAFADLITLKDEELQKPICLTHPSERWKKVVLENYTVKKLLSRVYDGTKSLLTQENIKTIAKRSEEEYSKFWGEYKRLINPQTYKVNLSEKLYNLRQNLLNAYSKEIEN